MRREKSNNRKRIRKRLKHFALRIGIWIECNIAMKMANTKRTAVLLVLGEMRKTIKR